MSVRVELNEIPDQVARFGAPALPGHRGDDGRAHRPACGSRPPPARCGPAPGGARGPRGRAPARHAAVAGPLEGFGLLVDGTAAVDGEAIVVTPTSAILHKLQEA